MPHPRSPARIDAQNRRDLEWPQAAREAGLGREAALRHQDDLPTLGLGLRWEDTPAGMRFRTLGRTVTEADITGFVGVTGMTEVLFTDVEYLREESLFDGRLVPGALVYAFAEGLLMQSVVQGVGLAFLGLEMRVDGPSFAGDTIHVECEVLVSRPTARPGRGLVTTRNLVRNQHWRVVMTYTPTRLVKGHDYVPPGRQR